MNLHIHHDPTISASKFSWAPPKVNVVVSDELMEMHEKDAFPLLNVISDQFVKYLSKAVDDALMEALAANGFKNVTPEEHFKHVSAEMHQIYSGKGAEFASQLFAYANDSWIDKTADEIIKDLENSSQAFQKTFVSKGPDQQAQGVLDTLLKAVPGLKHAKASCPANGQCGDTIRALPDVIIHLNDGHKWTREAIADWLETLDVDLSFAPPDQQPESAHESNYVSTVVQQMMAPAKIPQELLDEWMTDSEGGEQ